MASLTEDEIDVSTESLLRGSGDSTVGAILSGGSGDSPVGAI